MSYIHECLPQTMTPSNLADFIRSNKVDQINHVEKIPLTAEEIAQYEKDSSLASRAIDKLKDTEDYIKRLIKKGTPFDRNLGPEGSHRPVDVTIPPTKGIETLEANRKYADQQIEKGFKEDITAIYFIPWPEYEKMVAVSIEGVEWSKYSRGMSQDEIMQHGKPILKASMKYPIDDNGAINL